ncbi:unnamed protein product [Gordionus sp. m RMFG-2023]
MLLKIVAFIWILILAINAQEKNRCLEDACGKYNLTEGEGKMNKFYEACSKGCKLSNQSFPDSKYCETLYTKIDEIYACSSGCSYKSLDIFLNMGRIFDKVISGSDIFASDPVFTSSIAKKGSRQINKAEEKDKHNDYDAEENKQTNNLLEVKQKDNDNAQSKQENGNLVDFSYNPPMDEMINDIESKKIYFKPIKAGKQNNVGEKSKQIFNDFFEQINDKQLHNDDDSVAEKPPHIFIKMFYFKPLFSKNSSVRDVTSLKPNTDKEGSVDLFDWLFGKSNYIKKEPISGHPVDDRKNFYQALDRLDQNPADNIIVDHTTHRNTRHLKEYFHNVMNCLRKIPISIVLSAGILLFILTLAWFSFHLFFPSYASYRNTEKRDKIKLLLNEEAGDWYPPPSFVTLPVDKVSNEKQDGVDIHNILKKDDGSFEQEFKGVMIPPIHKI